LPRALVKVVQAAAPFIARAGRLGLLGLPELSGPASQYRSSALQICKLMAWIAEESGDQEAIALSTSAALLTVSPQDTEEYSWAIRTLDRITDSEVRREAVRLVERHVKRWQGERVEGDRYADAPQQLVESAAAALGLDISDENNPIVKGLRIAARDNTPERVLRTCEHILVSMGAIGPAARQIKMPFGIETAGSKVIHCALHKHHHESRELDVALSEFRLKHCDSCPDRSPRPAEWKY
jgi:hypothetical protein